MNREENQKLTADFAGERGSEPIFTTEARRNQGWEENQKLTADFADERGSDPIDHGDTEARRRVGSGSTEIIEE